MEEQKDDNAPKAAPAQVQMTISITRKATGAVETYQLIGTTTPVEQHKEAP